TPHDAAIPLALLCDAPPAVPDLSRCGQRFGQKLGLGANARPVASRSKHSGQQFASAPRAVGSPRIVTNVTASAEPGIQSDLSRSILLTSADQVAPSY